jgi:site-specific recombinase XerD
MNPEENLLSLVSGIELFIKHLKAQGRSLNTIIAYQGDLEQFAGFLAERNVVNVNQVEAEHVDSFKKQLKKKGFTAKTVSRKLNSIKSFFRFLQEEGVVEVDPSKNISHPKLKPAQPRILKSIEYRALRDACRYDARVTSIVELMLQAGLRIGEVANLRLEDIGETDLTIRAYESHQERKVPLNRAVKTALQAYLGVRGDYKTDYVFVTKTGRPLLIRNIRSALRRYFKKAGLEDVKVNDLRNTFIAYQLEGGVPLEVVSKIVGHKRISTTEKYLQLIERKAEDRKTIKLKEL